MLKNQDAVPEPQSVNQVSVSQARVTPEELNAALAAIEVRKQAEAKTIPIDQAVSELHLNSTADEIWTEVQAQRAKAAAQRSQHKEEQRTQEAQETKPRRRSGSGRRRMFAPLLLVGGIILLSQHGTLPHFWNNAPAAAPILRSLAQEPDGKTVYADDAALVQISEGKSPAQTTISENATGNRWPLVKMNGHVYLHGYIASTNSLHPLQSKALDVYNDDNSGGLEGASTSKITLRVDDTPLQQSGGDDGYSEVTVPNFQPDPLTTLSDWR
jgi:hypothetical protein